MDTPRSPVTYNGPNNAFGGGGGSKTFGLSFERADQFKGVPTVSFVDRNLEVPIVCGDSLGAVLHPAR
jgi:hypothetical protein